MIFVKISGSFTGKVYAGTEDTISVAHHVDSLPEDIMEAHLSGVYKDS
jgi:hypothetical protein